MKSEYLINALKELTASGNISDELKEHLTEEEISLLQNLQKDELVNEAFVLLNSLDTEREFRKLKNQLRNGEEMNSGRTWKKYLKYAAILLICLISGYSLLTPVSLFEKDEVKTTDILITTPEKATLTLSNGSVVVLDEEIDTIIKSSDLTSIESKNNTLSYTNNVGNANALHNELKETFYNVLMVPKGTSYKLVLPDNTKVWMNASSSIKFPEVFNDEKRVVELQGEAFFDVTKDKQHPFVVNTADLKVEVLGTRFNIANYHDELKAGVVLVEGSVKLYDERKSREVQLVPGMMGVLDRSSDTSEIQLSEVNTQLYTSWMQGRLIYRDMAFSEITKRLERKYNVKIINNNKGLDKQKFSGNLGQESIEEIMSYFSQIYGIDYTIRNNTIYIN